MTAAEQIQYSYTLTLLKMLQVGIPYDSIMHLHDDEVTMILAAQLALREQSDDTGR